MWKGFSEVRELMESGRAEGSVRAVTFLDEFAEEPAPVSSGWR